MSESLEAVKTESAPTAIGPYSQAIKANGFVYSSGQLGIDPETGEFAGDTAPKQCEQALKNLRAILKEAGTDMGKVVKTTVFLDNLADFAEVNKVYQTFFSEPFPARSCFQVAALPLGGKIEIEAVALL